tara:strand:+ start:328 stop:612 length:285 start_codon:yes stop_codon:yes gene_type:complete
MAKKSHDELLTKLAKQQDAIQNRIASLVARKRKDEDRILTRKKILIGAYMLEKLNETEQQAMIREMDTFLKRPLDRRLFGLPVAPRSRSTTPSN